MKKIKRTINDAKQPLISRCYVDVQSIWDRNAKRTVSQDLTPRIIKALSSAKTI